MSLLLDQYFLPIPQVFHIIQRCEGQIIIARVVVLIFFLRHNSIVGSPNQHSDFIFTGRLILFVIQSSKHFNACTIYGKNNEKHMDVLKSPQLCMATIVGNIQKLGICHLTYPAIMTKIINIWRIVLPTIIKWSN